MLSWMTSRLAQAAGQPVVRPAKTATLADRRTVAG
jgi:hypothetical protein